MKKKKFLFVIFIVLILGSCGKSNSDLESLTGSWIQKDAKASYQAGYVTDNMIEIYWVSNEGKDRALYWSGTFEEPIDKSSMFTWESKANTDKLNRAILASQDDTKKFTYDKGMISYEASALGQTKTVELKRTKEDYSLWGEEETESEEIATNEEIDTSEEIVENKEKEEQAFPEESNEQTMDSSSNEIRPEVKDALDSYEAFFNEYADFMNKYKNSTDVVSMLNDYQSYMTQYVETMNKFEMMKDSDMNAAELAYYTEVSLRINQTLLNAVQ